MVLELKKVITPGLSETRDFGADCEEVEVEHSLPTVVVCNKNWSKCSDFLTAF